MLVVWGFAALAAPQRGAADRRQPFALRVPISGRDIVRLRVSALECQQLDWRTPRPTPTITSTCDETIRDLRGSVWSASTRQVGGVDAGGEVPCERALAFGVEGQIEIADLIFGHGPDGKAVAMEKPRGTEMVALTA